MMHLSSVPLNEQDIADFEESGFLKIQHNIDLSSEITAYNREIEKSLSVQSDGIKRLGGYFSGHLNFNENEVAKSIFDKLIGPDTLETICRHLRIDHVKIRTNSNLNFPGSKFQHWHFDGDYENSFLILNVPLLPISSDNGPTEVLKGSHIDTKNFRRFVHAYRQGKTIYCPLYQNEVIFRDSRLWHRGTPNLSSRIRPMLAFIFERGTADCVGWQVADKRAFIYNNMYRSSLKGRAKEILLVQSRRLGYAKRYLLNEA